MGQVSGRNNNLHKGPALRHDRDTRRAPPRLVLEELPLWGGSGGREFAHQVAVQSAGFASGKVQRPSRTSARGR
jgi:hypothetical protein